jgi:hypothetical protein
VKHPQGATLTETEEGCEQLARFFPKTFPVRSPIQVTVLRKGTSGLREATIIEYGGAEHAIFRSTLPLEFDDRVRIERDRDTRTAEASVVAVQYHEGCKAVAVRFLDGPCAWVTHP